MSVGLVSHVLRKLRVELLPLSLREEGLVGVKGLDLQKPVLFILTYPKEREALRKGSRLRHVLRSLLVGAVDPVLQVRKLCRGLRVLDRCSELSDLLHQLLSRIAAVPLLAAVAPPSSQ